MTEIDNKQVVAQSLHEAACDPAGDACAWNSNEDPDLTDCRVLVDGVLRWRETGLETRVVESMRSHGLLTEVVEEIDQSTCKGCGMSFGRPAGPGCPMPVQHVPPPSPYRQHNRADFECKDRKETDAGEGSQRCTICRSVL